LEQKKVKELRVKGLVHECTMMLKPKMQVFNKIVRYAHDVVLRVKLGLKLEQSSKTLVYHKMISQISLLKADILLKAISCH